MKPLLFAFPGNDDLAASLIQEINAEKGEFTLRRFPDGETYIRIQTPVAERDIITFCTLHEPDEKILPLLFFAQTSKDLGARRVGLVSPYLAYLRQDRRFHEGEAVSSKYFAKALSSAFDWLVTVDPHLHRYHSLSEIYTIPTKVMHAAEKIGGWIRDHVNKPVLIGPDAESEQWVSQVARISGCPFLVLEKIRRGDRDVQVSLPDPKALSGKTPVLVDDIVSTARTMIEAVRHLRDKSATAPICIAVHGIFSGQAYEELLAAGAEKVITCNTIPHPSNVIDLSGLLVDGIKELETAKR